MSITKKAKQLKQHKTDILNHGSKLLCLFMLLGQMIGLDYLIIERDVTATIATRCVWIVMDTIVFLLWFATLLWSYILDRREQNAPANEKQQPGEAKEEENEAKGKTFRLQMLLRPLSLAPIIWLVYSLVLIAKVVRMFKTFALSLPQGEHLISSTFLKISLAKTAFILTLLIYALKSHVKDADKETLVTDKLGNAATLDVLDSIMLLDMLFNIDNPQAQPIYHGIHIFACICLILPAVPLVSTVFLAETENSKAFHMNLIVNTVFRLLMGNIPHIAFRLHLWHSHKADVSTFLIKNLVVVFIGIMDIIKHARKYKKGGKKKDKSSDPGEDLTLNVMAM